MRIHHSYLPLVFEGNSGLKKSHFIMIRSKFRTLSNINQGAFVRKKSTATSRYLFMQNVSS